MSLGVVICRRFSRGLSGFFKQPQKEWSPEFFERCNELEMFSRSNGWKPYETKVEIGDNLYFKKDGFFHGVFYIAPDTNEGKGLIMFGPSTAGRNNIFVHGGAVATLHDSITGVIANKSHGVALTGNLNISYKNPLLVHAPVRFDCRITKVDNRKVYLTSRAYNLDDTEIYNEAEALYILLKSAL